MTPDLRFPRVLHVLLHLSLRDRIMSSAEIAEMLSTNPVVVRRMLAGLRDQGLLEATQGRTGGWRIAKPLDQMTLLDVFEALCCPGQTAPSITQDHKGCPVEAAGNQALMQIGEETRAFIRARYASVKLSEIAQTALAASSSKT